MKTTPRIKTTLVGSYPVPDWLVAMPSEQALEDATRAVIHIQEHAGIDVVCDGEFYRFNVNHPEAQGMIEYFMEPMDGFRNHMLHEERIAYRTQKSMQFRAKPPGVVYGELGQGLLDLATACERAQVLASHPFKFTLTGPHMLAKTVINKHYKDTQGLAAAIAKLLAEQVSHITAPVVQIDEANLPGSPDEWPWAAKTLNTVLDAIKGERALHLCFGNYGGQVTQKGTWAKLIQYINSLHVDHLILELAHRGEEDLKALVDIKPKIGIGIGVIDIKSTEVEKPDLIAQRIEAATKVLGADRVTYVHPDCGFWNLKRHIADKKIKALVQGRDLFEGRSTLRAAS